MGLLTVLKRRLAGPDVPSQCPCCHQDEQPIERVGPIRYLCPYCAKDFEGVRDGEDWRFDLRPMRKRRSAS